MNKLKLVFMLKLARAGEIGAAKAYHGHRLAFGYLWDKITLIYQDELHHALAATEMLSKFGYKPSPLLDFIFKHIGHVAGFMCKFTGRRLPHFGAKLIEGMGVVNYNKMADLADKIGEHEMAEELNFMAETEKNHEEYFASLLA